MKAAREFVSDMAEHVSMPEVYVAIRKLLLNPDATMEEFVEVVERDSMLSVRVMRMAKSQYFGFPRNCENLYQAISLIGLIEAGRTEVDEAKRTAIYQELDRVLYETYADVWLWYNMEVEVLRRVVQGRNIKLYIEGREAYGLSHAMWFKDGKP